MQQVVDVSAVLRRAIAAAINDALRVSSNLCRTGCLCWLDSCARRPTRRSSVNGPQVHRCSPGREARPGAVGGVVLAAAVRAGAAVEATSAKQIAAQLLLAFEKIVFLV